MNDETLDQMAAIMLLRGTPEQQCEALQYVQDTSDLTHTNRMLLISVPVPVGS